MKCDSLAGNRGRGTCLRPRNCGGARDEQAKSQQSKIDIEQDRSTKRTCINCGFGGAGHTVGVLAFENGVVNFISPLVNVTLASYLRHGHVMQVAVYTSVLLDRELVDIDETVLTLVEHDFNKAF